MTDHALDDTQHAENPFDPAIYTVAELDPSARRVAPPGCGWVLRSPGGWIAAYRRTEAEAVEALEALRRGENIPAEPEA